MPKAEIAKAVQLLDLMLEADACLSNYQVAYHLLHRAARGVAAEPVLIHTAGRQRSGEFGADCWNEGDRGRRVRGKAALS